MICRIVYLQYIICHFYGYNKKSLLSPLQIFQRSSHTTHKVGQKRVWFFAYPPFPVL